MTHIRLNNVAAKTFQSRKICGKSLMNSFESLETVDVVNALLHTSQWYSVSPVCK